MVLENLDNYFVFGHSILKTQIFNFKNGKYKIEEPGIYIISFNQRGHFDNYICCFVLVSHYKHEALINTFLDPVYIFGNNKRPESFKYYPYTGVLQANNISLIRDQIFSLIKLC